MAASAGNDVAIMATLVEFASNLFVYFSPKAIMQSIDKKPHCKLSRATSVNHFAGQYLLALCSFGHVCCRVKKNRHYSTRLAAPSGGQKVNYKFRLAAIDTSSLDSRAP